MDPKLLVAAMMGAIASLPQRKNKRGVVFDGASDLLGLPKAKQEKQPRKCAYPSCDKMTTHNGGYCSAECCKKHKAR